MEKRVFAAAASVFLAAVCLISALAPAVSALPGNSRTLRVGFFAFDGYNIQDGDGRRSGYGYDFLQQLARYGDWTYEYVGYDKSWSEMQDMLANGEIDILTSAQKTPERQAKFAFSDKAIGTSSAILTVKSGDARYTIGDYATYDGMRVGLLKNSSRNESLAEFAEEKGFSYIGVYYDTVEQMTSDLQSGNGIDAIFTSNLRSIDGEWILDEFAPSDFYVMVRKNDTRLLSDINSAIDQLDMNQPQWRHELWNKYYTAKSSGDIAFTAREKAYIDSQLKNGTAIRAVVEPDRAPYSYFENGQAKGIIPEIFAKIERMTGLNFEIVETKTPAEYCSALSDGSGITVRIDAIDDYYTAEKGGFKLTSSYLTASVSEVSKKSSSPPYSSFALVKTSDPTPYRDAVIDSRAKLLEYDTMNECLDAVKNGTADAAYVLSYAAQRYQSESDLTGSLQAALLPQYSISYAIGVSDLADDCLLTVLDKAVVNLRQSDVESIIVSQAETQQHGITLWEYLITHPAAMVTAAALFALLLVMAALLLYRQKSVRLIESKNLELQAAAQRADKASAAKSEFLSRMSHDMRTPLNGVIGMTYLAQEQPNPPQTADYLRKIDTSSKFLLSLINDVLDMSKAESGKVELRLEPYPVEEFGQYITAVIGPLCLEKKQTLLFEPEKILSDVIPIFDHLRINQVVFNLLSNAVKYTPEGGSIRYRVAETKLSESSMTMHVDVIDNGIGMSEEFQKILFDPFTQEHRVDNSEMRGTGLGLAITKKLVDAMGGRISVKSKSGEGTTFSLDFTPECVPAGLAAGRSAAAAASVPDALSGAHVLISEDHPLNQEIAKRLLTDKGAAVELADDGLACVKLFRESTVGYFDCILMDIRMPVMDGYRAARAIRAMDRSDAKTVPIIAMTADAFLDDIRKCRDAGMNGHIAKPIDPAQLYDELARQLGREN